MHCRTQRPPLEIPSNARRKSRLRRPDSLSAAHATATARCGGAAASVMTGVRDGLCRDLATARTAAGPEPLAIARKVATSGEGRRRLTPSLTASVAALTWPGKGPGSGASPRAANAHTRSTTLAGRLTGGRRPRRRARDAVLLRVVGDVRVEDLPWHRPAC